MTEPVILRMDPGTRWHNWPPCRTCRALLVLRRWKRYGRHQARRHHEAHTLIGDL